VGASGYRKSPLTALHFTLYTDQNKRVVNIYYTNTCFGGRGVGVSTPKRRTEFSLVFNLLHNTSDCCEIETILPIALRHLK